jgi:hypothetical protein
MEEISKTVDFTNLTLEVDPGVHCFNPSIAHWKGNLFLCCYRAFVRYPSQISNQNSNQNSNPNQSSNQTASQPSNQISIKSTLDPVVDPNHPWLGGDKSVTWWNTVLGGDGTGFFILQIDLPQFNLRNVKRLNDGKSIFSLSSSSPNSNPNPLQTNWTKLKGVDARLLHLKGDYFLLSYNTSVYSNEMKIKQNQTCSSGCFMIATRLIKLNNQTGELGVFQENIMCPSISNPIEKNWSFFFSSNLFFSYGLAPSHQIYPATINFENGIVTCITPNLEKMQYDKPTTNFFGQLESFYNPTSLKSKFFHVSVTTPAIPNRLNPGRFIGVGHIKFKNKDQDALNYFQDTPLGKFYFTHSNLKRHPIYDYFMFLYEFDAKTGGTITRVSDAFLPDEQTNYVLSFPSGLEYASPSPPSNSNPNNNLMIAFGDHDSMCKLCIIRDYVWNKMLRRIKHPSDFQFLMLPKSCYTKRAAVCSLLLSV